MFGTSILLFSLLYPRRCVVDFGDERYGSISKSRLRIISNLRAPFEDAVIVAVNEVEARPGRLVAARQGGLSPIEGVEPPVIRGRVRYAKRDLASAQSFWRDVVGDHEVRGIYAGEPLCERGYESLGPLSIDHFVPWSFVLHDEPWNLVPTFLDVNSSKSDKLPDLGLYLEPFCELQFDALMTAKAIGGHRKVLEAYLTVDPHALEYERTNAARESFCSTIRNAVVPLHQIALNQGFGIWGLRV